MTTACCTDDCACVAGGEVGIALSGGGARSGPSSISLVPPST
jgi:hypothetical protein